MNREVHPIDRAASLLGITQAKLGALLGVSKAAVGQWKQEGRQVPPEHCPKIERLTQGRVRCEELNDRIDWAYLRGSAGVGRDRR
ncbi:MAG: transcriptional regulator [Burkholderiaceae bacterium]